MHLLAALCSVRSETSTTPSKVRQLWVKDYPKIAKENPSHRPGGRISGKRNNIMRNLH